MRIIDADHAIDAIKRLGNRKERRESRLDEAIKMLSFEEYTPTIDAEPVRHGHWIKVDEEYDQCSLCGCVHHYTESYGYYCQRCGAKMDEVEDDE